jgi:hypothetical protein
MKLSLPRHFNSIQATPSPSRPECTLQSRPSPWPKLCDIFPSSFSLKAPAAVFVIVALAGSGLLIHKSPRRGSIAFESTLIDRFHSWPSLWMRRGAMRFHTKSNCEQRRAIMGELDSDYQRRAQCAFSLDDPNPARKLNL